ncbi:MAG: hypothetical protein ACFFA3_10840 [Promethearchaeota archaeon]
MHKKFGIVIILVICTLFSVVITSQSCYHTKNLPTEHYSNNVNMASLNNYNNLNSIFTDKIDDYNEYGFFPQIYEPSLQATYYGLFILDAIGKLERVNKTQITDYIMSTYDWETRLFMDSYAYRFLDTDFSRSRIYPLTSLLEVNCYAILSLDLLNALNLIDCSAAIKFIKSCYNNITSGFIGQPFSNDLQYYAKISTMDNTFYAIKTLDLLLDSWTGYTQERDNIIQYINDLQIIDNSSWEYGGFANDNENYFFSLKLYTDVHIFSSYYCFKSLELLGMEESVNFGNFNEFLEELYNSEESSFYYMKGYDQYNIVATALGLNLANFTDFISYNWSATVNFIFEHRNTLGIWDGSSNKGYHELIDTFQIIRALKDSNIISRLSLTDTNLIADVIINYFSSNSGFSLISMDYTTLNLFYTITSSFELYDKLPELDFQEIYSMICDVYYYNPPLYHGFWGVTRPEIDGETILGFRSLPIEFETMGQKINFTEVEYTISHKYTYYALEVLKIMFKLDDFALTCNLNKLMDDIISTQFLNNSYPEYYGGFSYIYPYSSLYDGLLVRDIYFEYSYYAIKVLELLAEQLDIGDLTFLDFNIDALNSYIENNIVETPELLYFNPTYTNNIETILEYTYYMIYTLKAIGLFDLNIQKLRNLIEYNLNYTNIKNLYFSFKIAEILEFDVGFEIDKVQKLVTYIFSPRINEYYLTSRRDFIDQEIFLWICEMASSHNHKIIAQYPEQVMLGNHINIDASLSNIILSYFDYNLSFIFESAQVGNYEFQKIGNNDFSLDLLIPQHTNNYPNVVGKIYALNNNIKLAEVSIMIITYYPEKVYRNEINSAIVLSVLFIMIPGGVIIFSEKKLKKRDPNLTL